MREPTWDAVVTIPKGRDFLAVTLRAHSVESAEQIIEESHQLVGGLIAGHPGESHDVGEQNRDVLHGVHVERPKYCADIPLMLQNDESTKNVAWKSCISTWLDDLGLEIFLIIEPKDKISLSIVSYYRRNTDQFLSQCPYHPLHHQRPPSSASRLLLEA